jgi:hypothetical protein
MTINIAMVIKLTRVRVGNSGLRKIKAILLSMKPTTCATFILAPYFANMMKNHDHGILFEVPCPFVVHLGWLTTCLLG